MINDVCLSESERHRLEQELGADEQLRSFPLQSGMVQEVACKPGGYGNLVFAYTRDERNGAREERVARQVGFIDIPQVRHVQTILRETIAEHERKLARNNR